MTAGPPRVRPRKPWLAALLSLLLPGLGHLYAGQPRRALGRWAMALGVGLAVFGLLLWVPFGAITPFLAAVVVLAVIVWIPVDAARTARAAPADFTLRGYNRWFLYAVLIVANSFVPGIPKAFVRAYRVASPAMEPTLLVGDRVWVRQRRAPEVPLRRGTLVVYETVEAPGLVTIKRVAGLPGDTLSMHNNVLLRNGSRVEEPYLAPSNAQEDHEDPRMRAWQLPHYLGGDAARYHPTARNWGPLLVPPDSLFLLGDNRDNSWDSRFWGFVGRDRLRGRPLVIYYSLDPHGPLPVRWLTAMRGDRIGKRFQ